jgi:hypothetical protein
MTTPFLLHIDSSCYREQGEHAELRLLPKLACPSSLSQSYAENMDRMSVWYIVLNLNTGQTYRPKGSCHNNSLIIIHSNSLTFNKAGSVWHMYYFYFPCEAL